MKQTVRTQHFKSMTEAIFKQTAEITWTKTLANGVTRIKCLAEACVSKPFEIANHTSTCEFYALEGTLKGDAPNVEIDLGIIITSDQPIVGTEAVSWLNVLNYVNFLNCNAFTADGNYHSDSYSWLTGTMEFNAALGKRIWVSMWAYLKNSTGLAHDCTWYGKNIKSSTIIQSSSF